MLDLLQESSGFFLCVIGLLGLCVGSFLNVVIYRLPIMMERAWKQQATEILHAQSTEATEKFNLIVPRSACPHCNSPVGAMENIPVLSYLVLRGRCRSCKAAIAKRYPVIEAITALLSIWVAWKFDVSIETAAALILTWSLVALTVIDLDHQLLPDSITLPLIWLGLALALVPVFADLRASVIGALVGYLSLRGFYEIFRLITGKEGMGHGDFKLFAAFGAWLGWQSLLLIIVLSSLVGSIVGITMILFGGHKREIPIAFGPYLAAAGWIAMMYGNEILTLYFRAAGMQ